MAATIPNRTRFEPPVGTSAYRVRLAQNRDCLEAAQRLRYRVFNLELNEGLAVSALSGRDEDAFDPVCDHLLVESVVENEIIGTYRLQTGLNARANLGYYSEQEFDFTVFRPYRGEILELGRACVAREHRNMVVLGLLWKGIARYALAHGARYLVGCSSLTSTDSRDGAAVYRQLRETSLCAPEFRTVPTPAFSCSLDGIEDNGIDATVPRLMAAYLAVGARVCGPPAIDREFGTIDFLTLLDMKNVPERVVLKYLS